jgi:CelD/BcsL family acetyltransferase involved in cellulose biosynthesis
VFFASDLVGSPLALSLEAKIMVAAHTPTALPLEFRPAAEECTVHVCRTWEELEQFRESWDRLLPTNPASSIFQTPEWLMAWWQAFGSEKELLGLVFADADGHALGIAPLYREQTFCLGRTLATLRMVGAGSGDSDALDFITSPGSEQVCADAFLAWLDKQSDWDICALETLPQNSHVAKRLGTRLHEAGWSVDTTLTPNFVVDLPADWKEYLNSLEPSFRPLLTRYPRRLHSRYRVRIRRTECAEDLKDHLDILFQLHQMRWTGRGEPGAFASTNRRDFYVSMAAAFLRRGWLEFWLLELDGEIVGAQFCFRYNDTVSLLQEGFHPKYAAEKIGYALRAHVVQEMIRGGAKRYDFLGGDDPYKAKFGAHQKNYLNLSFAGPSRMGRAYLAVQKRRRHIKTWLKSKLPNGVLARLRRDSTAHAPSTSQ